MGENLIMFYKNNIKQQWKIAFFTAFFACLLTHIYKFTNTLPNHDSFFNVYTNQDMTISGRWFLQFVCGISSYFDLPWINGLLCAVYIGITAAVITELFDLKNPIVIALSGLLIAACPSTTETLFFGFTADGYFLGLMISTFSAYFSSKASRRYHYLISGTCICLSCAIYQAYVSFAIILCVCFLIIGILENQITVKDAWKWIGKHILLYVVSMAAYYVLWKIILSITGQAATGYQGISTVGQVSVSALIHGAVASVKNLFFLLLEWNILEHPISLYAVLNIFFIIGFVYVFITAIVKSGIYRSGAALFLVLLALVLCVPIISIWSFLSETVQYRPMMLHSAVVFYILAVILFDRWTIPRISTAFGLGIAVMIFNFTVMANISYFYLDKCYEKSYYMGSRIMEQIEEVQQSDDSVTQIAFIGSRVYDVSVTPGFPGNRIHILSSLLEEDFLYDHTHSYLYLKNTFGLSLDQTSEDRRSALESRDEVQDMGSWPAHNSIQVIDGVLIIKLEDSP